MSGDTKTNLQDYIRQIGLLVNKDMRTLLYEFACIVDGLKSKRILESTAVFELTEMMKKKLGLFILSLNEFLPEGFKIEKSEDGLLFYRSPSEDDAVPLLYYDMGMQQKKQVLVQLSEAVVRIREQSTAIDELQKQINEYRFEEMKSSSKSLASNFHGRDKHKRKRNDSFDDRIEELKTYKAAHGHIHPHGPAYMSLALWCTNVRYSYRAMREGRKIGIHLTDDRIEKLKALGFDFSFHHLGLLPKTTVAATSLNTSNCNRPMPLLAHHEYGGQSTVASGNDSFNQNLNALRYFKAANRHLRVTERNYKSLAKWCKDIRRSYHAKERGLKMVVDLTDERIASLKELGFDFKSIEINSVPSSEQGSTYVTSDNSPENGVKTVLPKFEYGEETLVEDSSKTRKRSWGEIYI